MTISKSHVQISTINAAIALVLGIGSIFAIFYNTRASLAEAQSKLSERVAVVETQGQQYTKDIADIKQTIKEVPELVRLVKRAYPNY